MEETTTDKIVAWLKSPMGVSVLRNALAPAVSFASLWLIKWGFPALDPSLALQMAVGAAPFVVVTFISAVSKTKAAIITQAAKILADRQAKGEGMTPEVAAAAGPLVKAVASMPGIEVQVSANAPEGAKAVASDTTTTNVTHS